MDSTIEEGIKLYQGMLKVTDHWHCETPHPHGCRWAWDGYEYVCNTAITHLLMNDNEYAELGI